MADAPEPERERSKFQTFKGGMKKTLLAFVLVDALLIVGAIALYLAFFRPQILAIEARRDDAVRANVAMTARVYAVEARLALAAGDPPVAARAADDVRVQVDLLLARIPRQNTRELEDVRGLSERSKLIADEIQRDPVSARRDLELIDARLAALYPAAAIPPTK
jgi:hypothetical protein